MPDSSDSSRTDMHSHHTSESSSESACEPGCPCNTDRDRDGAMADTAETPQDSHASSSTMQRNEVMGAPTHGQNCKRRRLGDTNDDHSCVALHSLVKQAMPESKKLICCFRYDSEEPCGGTDKNVSEVVAMLARWHATYICERCWVLLRKDGSGRLLHPNPDNDCIDYCLSPRCQNDTGTVVASSVARRHVFNRQTCGTKSSRVRPRDSEAAFRFIFSLVHQDTEPPPDVFTTDHLPHRDAAPKQGRRKATRVELLAQANAHYKGRRALQRRCRTNRTDQKPRM